ncbi:hypothetical protein SALBM311S_01700 [Streptomyces alboniger]
MAAAPDLNQAYLPFLHGVGLANYFTDPAFRAGLAKPVHEDRNAAVLHFVNLFADPAKTWPRTWRSCGSTGRRSS